MKKVIKKIKED